MSTPFKRATSGLVDILDTSSITISTTSSLPPSPRPVRIVSRQSSIFNSTDVMTASSSKSTTTTTTTTTSGVSLTTSLRILLTLLNQTDGRDKLYKLIQYALKWSLLSPSSSTSTTSTSSNLSSTSVRIKKETITLLSRTRKSIRLLHALDSFLTLSTTPPSLSCSYLSDLFGSVSDSLDDIAFLMAIQVIRVRGGGEVREWVEWWAACAWWCSIHVDAWGGWCAVRDEMRVLEKVRNGKKDGEGEGGKEEEEEVVVVKQRQKVVDKSVAMVKLVADYVFCTVDVAKWDMPRVQIYAALVSALAGTYKLVRKAQQQ